MAVWCSRTFSRHLIDKIKQRGTTGWCVCVGGGEGGGVLLRAISGSFQGKETEVLDDVCAEEAAVGLAAFAG